MKKKNKKLFNNKKGVLSGLTDLIGNLVQGITNILPKPVLFILFLFLIATLGYVLSLIFNSFGIYCNSADQPVQLNANFLTGISLIGEIPDPKTLGLDAIDTEEWGITTVTGQVDYCAQEQLAGATYITDDGTRTNLTSDTWFYDGTFCTDCAKVKIYDVKGDRVGGITKKWCLGDVTRNTDQNLLQKALCGGISCQPPEHYYYESSQNTYLCSDETCKGITLGQRWDELLSSKGATLMYPNQESERNPSHDKIIGITCTELKPKIAVWGFDILNYTNMIFLLLLIGAVWLYFKLH